MTWNSGSALHVYMTWNSGSVLHVHMTWNSGSVLHVYMTWNYGSALQIHLTESIRPMTFCSDFKNLFTGQNFLDFMLFNMSISREGRCYRPKFNAFFLENVNKF